MLKLAVFLIAALAAPSLVRAQYELVYIWGLIYSHNVGYETCSYSSADWIQSFYSSRLNIESVFHDWIPGNQHPTIQKSFRITFTQPGSPVNTETYAAPNPSFPFPSTFTSGSTTTGWVDILIWNPNFILIVDYTTGSLILASNWGNMYHLFLFAPTWFIERGEGILVSGCPYKDVFDYSTGWKTPYNANPNWGRRKRQNDECSEIAKIFAENFPQYKGLSEQIVNWICSIDSKFVEGTKDALKKQVEILLEAEQVRQKFLNDDFKPEAKRDIDQEKTDTVRNF